MFDTKHKMIFDYYDPSVSLDLLAKEGWTVVSHSVSYDPVKNMPFYTVLLKKDPPPYINRGPG